MITVITIVFFIAIAIAIFWKCQPSDNNLSKWNHSNIQSFSSLVGMLALVFAAISIYEDKEQTKATQRANELTVLPYIYPQMIGKQINDLYYMKITNLLDKPALNIRVLVFDKDSNKFFFADEDAKGNEGYEFLKKEASHEPKYGNNSVSTPDKKLIQEELINIYGKEVKPLFKNIKDNHNKSSIYVFFEDMNGKIRLAIRDFEFDKETESYNHFYRRLD